MRKLLPVLALAAIAAGCIDLEQEYTVNPDGSGKVVVHWVGAPFDLGPAKSPEAKAKAVMLDEINKADGIDTWKDVSCTARDDGKFEFKGTAYFKDFSKLKLHNTGMSMIALKASKDASGNLVIVNEPEKKGGGGKQLSDEEAKKKLKEERAQYQQSKRFVEGMLADLKVSAKVNLPGKVGSASNFKKASDTAITIALEGKTFMKVLDELMGNDDWMLKQLKESGSLQDSAPSDDVLNEKVFGEKGPIRAVTTGALTPLFDYEAEAGPARAAFEEFVKKLGGGPVGPPAKGGDFKSFKVAGVRHVYAADMEQGLMPLGMHQPGMSLSFMGELPGTVLSMKEGKIKVATADNGEDLLPEQFQRSIHWVQLAKDKTTIMFDVNLLSPSDKVKGLKEVSGVLTYTVGGKTKAVELGFGELKQGAKGAAHDAEIVKLEDSQWQEGHQNLELKLALNRDLIAKVVFKDETGSVLKTNDSGSMGGGDETTLTFTLKGKFPAKGKVSVEIYEDLKTYEIPFKIENVDLLGKPRK